MNTPLMINNASALIATIAFKNYSLQFDEIPFLNLTNSFFFLTSFGIVNTLQSFDAVNTLQCSKHFTIIFLMLIIYPY